MFTPAAITGSAGFVAVLPPAGRGADCVEDDLDVVCFGVLAVVVATSSVPLFPVEGLEKKYQPQPSTITAAPIQITFCLSMFSIYRKPSTDDGKRFQWKCAKRSNALRLTQSKQEHSRNKRNDAEEVH